MMESLRAVFFKIDRIHYSMFDVGRSMFDVHSFFSDQTGCFLAGGGARVKLIQMFGIVERIAISVFFVSLEIRLAVRFQVGTVADPTLAHRQSFTY